VISEQAGWMAKPGLACRHQQVDGPVVADDYLELQPKAQLTGDVTYKTLEMHVGAVLRGRLLHAEPGTGSVVVLKRATAD
jgi:cytoskeletal protein CcmA (bactofilin family)